MNRARLFITLTLLSVFLAFSLIACGATDVSTRPTPASDSGSDGTGSMSSRPLLIGMKAEEAGRQTRIVLESDQPMTYTSVMEDQPPVIVLDIGAETTDNNLGPTVVKNGLVENVEISPLSGVQMVLRVKIMLNKPTGYQVVREGTNLVVLVENIPGQTNTAPYSEMDLDEAPLTPAQMDGGTALVKGVDFKPLGNSGRTRLIVKTSKVVKPQVLARDGGQTVVLSIAPANIPGHLIRSLDTTFFRSSVNYVKPTMASGKSVEFMIRLRSVVPYHLGQKGLYTYMDFDPSPVSPKKASVSPVTKQQAAALPQPNQPALPAPGGATPANGGAKGAGGAGTPAGEPKKYTGQRITLDFQNADIHNILRLIGEVSGKNVVVSDKVQGKVTLKLTEVPWDQALDIVLAANQLAVVESGNVLRIDLAEVIRAEKELEIKELEQNNQREQNLPLVKKVFTPSYAAVEVMQTELEKLKSERGKLTVIGNDIYVEEEPKILASMQAVFNKNDKVARQILIESRIVEAQSSFTKNLGVNWGGAAIGNETTGPLSGKSWAVYGLHSGGGIGAGGPVVNLINPTSTGLGLGFALLDGVFNLDAQLYAMEQTGEGRIVSAPRILASNDQEVYIQQGQSIPYESSGTTTTPSTITYNEAVLELRVKPHIEENGNIISMDIVVKKDTADYSLSTRNPPINRREAKTKLMVRNGETVVIGGIIIDEQAKTVNRVPGLHRIPVLGWLFKSYSVSDTKLELLIFLTSNIIPVRI